MSPHTPPVSIAAPASLVDPFLILPTELVGWIFDIVDDAIPVTSNALGLVSRTFLPFVRHKTFERVNLWSPRRFTNFLDCAKDCPSVLSYIEILEINIQSKPEDTEFDDQLPKLLQNLTSIVQLEIVNYKRLMYLVLDPPSDPPSLPSLRALNLGYDDTNDVENYLEPRYWTKLHLYPELWSLYLKFPTEFISYHTITRMKKDLEIQELALIAPFEKNPAIVDLLDHFRSLTTLHLRPSPSNSYSSSASHNIVAYPLSSTLRSMKHPNRIETLTLDLDSFESNYSSILPRFAKLETLHLKQGDCDKEMLKTFQSSFPKLKHLAFDFTSRVSTDDLVALLAKDNSNRPSELSVLTLNTLRVVNNHDSLMEAWCIDESDGELSISSKGSRADGFGLSIRDAGARTDEYTMAGVRKVLKMGEEVGVELRGNDVERVQEVRKIFEEDQSYWMKRARSSSVDSEGSSDDSE